MRKQIHKVHRRHVWRLDITDLDLSELTAEDLMKEIGWVLGKAPGPDVETIAKAIDTCQYGKACSLISKLLIAYAPTRIEPPAIGEITRLEAHTWYAQANEEVRARIGRDVLLISAKTPDRSRDSIKLDLIKQAILTERKRPKL